MDHSSPEDEQRGGNKHIKEEEPAEEDYISTAVCGNAAGTETLLSVSLHPLLPRSPF